MAILIPSKNIYDKQNPKVRDNVIERIEVSAVEIIPDNKYEEPVANIVEYKKPTKGEPQTDIIGDSASLGVGSQVYNTVIAYIQGTPYYYDLTIKIPLIKENSYISSLLLGVDDYKNANIKYSVAGTIKTGEVTATLTRTNIGERDVEISNIVKGEPTQKQSTFTNIPYKYSCSDKYGGSLAEAKAKAEISFDEGNIKEIEKANIVIDNGKEYYQFYLRVIAGVDIVKVSGGDEYAYVDGYKTLNIESKGEYEEYLLEKIEVTVYGNTIGIDLQDKTIYIPNTDTTSKKVFSVDGNELMQANYRTVEIKGVVLSLFEDYKVTLVSSSGEEVLPTSRAMGDKTQVTFLTDRAINRDKTITYNDSETITIYSGATSYTFDSLVKINKIETHDTTEKILDVAQNFARVQKSYSKGKETATIRCSISDYYDGDEKVIAIDNSTGKMSFNIGDRIIPMVYGADGKDRPMSIYQDGSAKEFEVLGAKKFYDGAVWQELSVQEV